MVSVVVATYNGERYLWEQLKSIAAQTQNPQEIIICDDASTDSTLDIIRRFQQLTDIPTYCFVNDYNMGFAKNYFKALYKAKGDIIFLSDQDDVWEDNKIEEIVKFFECYPTALAVSTSYKLIDSDGKQIIYKRVRFKNDKSVKVIRKKTFLRYPKYPGMAMAVRRKLLKNIGCINLNRHLPAHDWFLNVYAANLNGLYFYDCILTNYRQHESNTVGILGYQRSDLIYNSRVQVLELIIGNLNYLLSLQNNDYSYLNRISNVYQKRLFYLKNRCGIKLLIYDLSHLKYMHINNILGDLYAVCGGNKGKGYEIWSSGSDT